MRINQKHLDYVYKQFKNTPLWLKAPNGKPTNLTEEKWLIVRTIEFKEHYGNWESVAIKRFIEGNPIVEITGFVFSDDGTPIVSRIAKWMKDKDDGDYVRDTPLGDVRITSRDIKDSWREGRRAIRAEAFRVVPDVLKKGIVINLVKDYKGKSGLTRGLIAAPVVISGKRYYVIVAVQYDMNAKRMVFHDAYTVERTMFDNNKEAQQEFLATGAVPQNEGQRTSPADNSVEPVLNVLRRHLFVNQNELKCRLDENGEPVLD